MDNGRWRPHNVIPGMTYHQRRRRWFCDSWSMMQDPSLHCRGWAGNVQWIHDNTTAQQVYTPLLDSMGLNANDLDTTLARHAISQ